MFIPFKKISVWSPCSPIIIKGYTRIGGLKRPKPHKSTSSCLMKFW
jgi:hypothetical protein